MNILFFDTETTGLPKFDLHEGHPSQPKIVQLAAILCNEKGKEISSLNFIMNPECEIPIESSNIHGITTEMAKNNGIYIKNALPIFKDFLCNSNLLIGHNVNFDIKMIKISLHSLENLNLIGELDSSLENIEKYCTMMNASKICNLPKFRGNGYKWPKLTEAYEFAFNKKLENAHNAMADARAAKDIYFWLRKQIY